jgi:hypothetical protein
MDSDELILKAMDILNYIRNHDELIFQGQTGNFDLLKIIEFASENNTDFISIPKDCGVAAIINEFTDRINSIEIFNITPNVNRSMTSFYELVSIDSPVNLQVSPVEIRPGLLIINLWR